MRILYCSCHSVLEFDEVKLFHELGYEVFSPGAYVEPLNPGDASMRPGIPGLVYDPDILASYHAIGAAHPGEDGKDHLTKEFVDKFDVVIVMHLPRWIKNNWQAMKHKRVIWRTIGQSINNTERELLSYRLDGLEIVRYSPMEANIPGYIGEDALIRFYKDPASFYQWEGNRERVITFCQSMQARGPACNFEFFREVTEPFERHLFGPGNEGYTWSTGKISFEQQKCELRDNRVYFYTGTHPASYTLNFIEAWQSGIPIVAIGPRNGNASYFPGHNLYEIPRLIQNGVNGFMSDDLNELRGYISLLLKDRDIALQVGEKGRQEAIRHFGKDLIKASWKAYLEK